MTVAVVLTRICPSLPEPLPVQLRPPLSEPALAFVVALGASSSEEVELQLQGRMEFSKAAVSRVVEASDRLQRRVDIGPQGLGPTCSGLQVCQNLPPGPTCSVLTACCPGMGGHASLGPLCIPLQFHHTYRSHRPHCGPCGSQGAPGDTLRSAGVVPRSHRYKGHSRTKAGRPPSGWG